MDVRFSESITEVLEILKHMDKMYTEKLPKKFIKFLQDNQDISYIPKYNYTKELRDCDIHKETKALLGIMYLNYWSCEEQKKEYLQILDNNQKKYQAEIKEKYNPNNLFKNKKLESNSENMPEKLEKNMQIIEYNESIFKKIIYKIKLFLKIK